MQCGRVSSTRFVAGASVNDADTACEAVAQGLGVGQPPAYYVGEQLASGALVPILERYAPNPRTLYVCYRSAKQLPMRTRAFVELARTELAKEPWVK